MFKKADELDNLVRKMDSGTDVLGFHAPVIGISGNFREGDCTLAQGYYTTFCQLQTSYNGLEGTDFRLLRFLDISVTGLLLHSR